jgi:hypothetical protein
MHQARCGVHSCVQAAAAARVADLKERRLLAMGGCQYTIFGYAEYGFGALVLCHLIADADSFNERFDSSFDWRSW